MKSRVFSRHLPPALTTPATLTSAPEKPAPAPADRNNKKDNDGTKLLPSFRPRTQENSNDNSESGNERIFTLKKRKTKKKGTAIFRRNYAGKQLTSTVTSAENSETTDSKDLQHQQLELRKSSQEFIQFDALGVTQTDVLSEGEHNNSSHVTSSADHTDDQEKPTIDQTNVIPTKNENLSIIHSSSVASIKSDHSNAPPNGINNKDRMGNFVMQKEQSFTVHTLLDADDDYTPSSSPYQTPQQSEEVTDLWNWDGSDMDMSSENGNFYMSDDAVSLAKETINSRTQTATNENYVDDDTISTNLLDELTRKTKGQKLDGTPRLSNSTLRKRVLNCSKPPSLWAKASSEADEKSVESATRAASENDHHVLAAKDQSVKDSAHKTRQDILRKVLPHSPRSMSSREIPSLPRLLKSKDSSRASSDPPVYSEEHHHRGFHFPVKIRHRAPHDTEEAVRTHQDKSFRRRHPLSPNFNKSDSLLDYDHHQPHRGSQSSNMKQKSAQHFLDSESDGRTKKDQVTEKVHRLRRRLNPRSNTVQWRYRIEENHSEVSCSDDDMALDEMCRTRDRRLSWDGTIDEKSVVSDLNRTPCGVRPLPVSDGISMRASDPNHHDIIEYRVKPYSCFLPEKMYMTEQEIYNDSMRQSEAAEFVKSFVKPWYPSKVSNQNNYVTSLWGSSEDGRIGSLRVEVLGCIGLPKNKPDVSVYLVCGDSAFSTDVINAARSPMWPAKSKRAVVFPLMHAFLHLYVGVFDVLTRRNAENDTFFGRAMVDIAMLRPHTEYDVTLPLRNSSFVYERRPRGVVRLRFSLHWFSGRAAVLSYLREPQNLVPAYEEIPQPSIRCADPKTFRNIAVTVHGSDLPGKYTRKAFQATTREFNLYRLNVLFALKTTAQDAVMYEKPILSLYLFMSWMHCVYLSSMRLVPVYTVGTLVYMLVENYRTFILHRGSHLGYSPVTLREIFMSLLTDGAMEPFVVAKKVKHRSTGDSIIEVETRDHREFPFSEKVDYPKLTVEESVLRRHAGGGRKERKEAGRLSVYIKAGQPADQLFDSTNRTVSSSSTISLASADDVVNEDNDNDTEGDEDHDHEDIHDDSQDWDDMAGEHADDLDGCNDWWCESGFRRIPSGPPQDTNVKPRKKIPPQVHLARLEETLNRFTQHISQDRLYWRTLSLRPECEGKPNYQTNDHDEEESANTNERRKKRLPLDDFDKKLGLRRRHPNPVVEITSSFLGPLMRIFRIICITVRVVFNISVWRDPFLSFWALCALLLLMLILVVFPWRFFFCVLGTVALGPQNMLLRNHLYQNQNRNAGDDQDEQSDKSNEERIHHEWKDSNVESETHCGTEIQSIDNESIESATLKRGNNRRRIHTALANLKERRQRRRNDRTAIGGTPARPNSIDSGGESNVGLPPRQPFSGVPTSSASFRRTPKYFQPREIVVPYSRFRKERFYDWPPDPTVSRATPVNLEDCFCNGVFEGDIPREKSM